MSGDFTPEQKRYLEGFVSGLTAARRQRPAAPARLRRTEPVGPDADPHQGAGRGAGLGQETLRPGEVQARAASVRRLWAAEGAGGDQRGAEAGGQFPLALLRPVLLRTGAELVHVPAADPERHPQALAIRRPGRPHRPLRRRLFPRDHPRQSAGPRGRAEERRGAAGGDPRPRALLARVRRRQHPQCHRDADRRDRSAGADRHPALRARMALPHPERTRAVRTAAQVQRRVRRRRYHSGAGGHQRHRLSGRRGVAGRGR